MTTNKPEAVTVCEDRVRAEFEEWAVSGGYALDCMISGHYIYAVTSAAWNAWRASRVAPAVQREPVAWMHDSPGRVDVIHAEVKKLLVDSHDTAGHLHRPLDKSEHYTIPLYRDAQSAPDVAGLVSELDCRRLLAGFAMDCNAVGADYAAKKLFRGMKLLARTAAHRKGGGA